MNDVALVVIDMQNDFCDPASRLFVAGAPEIEANVARVMTLFREAGQPVVVYGRPRRRPDAQLHPGDSERRDLARLPLRCGQRRHGFGVAGDPGRQPVRHVEDGR